MPKIQPRWTNWVSVNSDACKQKSAVYRIRLVKNDSAVKIPRFLGIDPKGLLCIGSTVNIKKRIGHFKKSVLGGQGHSGGELLHIVMENTKFKQKYKRSKYEYSFAKCESKEQAKLQEEKEIKEYVKQFGETPPLNSSIPGRKNGRFW